MERLGGLKRLEGFPEACRAMTQTGSRKDGDSLSYRDVMAGPKRGRKFHSTKQQAVAGVKSAFLAHAADTLMAVAITLRPLLRHPRA